MSDNSYSSGNPPASNRRSDWRENVLLSCVELSEENGGIVLNISQGGLAIQAVAELNDDELPRMRFQFSQSQSWIEAKARIVWRSRSKKMAGVQFIGLSDEARNQIRTWISGLGPEKLAQCSIPTLVIVGSPVPEVRNATSVLTDTVTKNGTGSPFVLSYQEPKYDREKRGSEGTSVSRRVPRLIRSFLVTVLFLLSAVFLGYYFLRANHGPRSSEVAAPATAPVPNRPGNPEPTAAPKPLPDRPGFVLQVGAMSHKENADSLAESLRQRNFPTFVFKGGMDRFYHVLVGPYNGADNIVGVENELENQGFKPIRTEWKPLSQ